MSPGLPAPPALFELVSEFGEVALVHFAKEIDKLDPAHAKALRRLARGA